MLSDYDCDDLTFTAVMTFRMAGERLEAVTIRIENCLRSRKPFRLLAATACWTVK